MKPRILLYGTPEGFANYRAALERSGAEAVFTLACPDAAEYAGLLLPGGGDMESWRYGRDDVGCRGMDPLRDSVELELLARYAAAGKPIFGICRGLQVINVFFGGTLFQDIPDHAQLGGHDQLHPALSKPGSLLEALYGACCTVNSSHHQAVERPGAGLEITQRAGDGTVEGLEHRTKPVLAVQWHPERLCGSFSVPQTVDGQRIFDAFVSRCRT